MQKYFLILFMILKLATAEFSLNENQFQSYNLVQLVHRIVKNVEVSDALPENFEFPDKIENTSYFVANLLDFDNYSSNVSSYCLQDWFYALKNVNLNPLKKSWASQMFDAYGGPESGFQEGNLKWLGDFDECRKVYAPKGNKSDRDFYGKYCKLEIPVDPMGNPFAVLTMGLCLPDSCSSSDLNHDIKKFVNIINNIISINITKKYPFIKYIESMVNSSTVTCFPNKRELSNAAVATIGIFSFFILLTALGSIITILKHFTSFWKNKNCSSQNSVSVNDYDQGDADDILIFTEGSKTRLSVLFDKVDPFLNCFCIFTNGSKLLNTDSTEGQMLCLHGIRFLSMSWVIICHTYAFSFLKVKKMRALLDFIDNWPFQVVLNGFYSVDSFFVLSAFLMSYLYLQEAAKRKGNISWIYFYVHRYLRLTPVYMLMIGFYTTLYPYLGSGPFWLTYDIDPVCQKNWWWNALYINNFLSATTMCMSWSWYLANDMQFFIISPLFLIPLWRWPKIGYSILGGFLGISIVVSFVISYHFELFSGFGNLVSITAQANFMDQWASYFDKFYIKPYVRIGPYIVGIALGYFMFKRQLNDSKTNKITLFIGWVLATAVGLTCVYGLYHKTPNVTATSFYNALSRIAYAICLGWVIFTCLTKQAGAVDKILSYKLFIPLSRLTYCAYLIHPMVITAYFDSMKMTLDFNHKNMVIHCLGFILVTYAFSLVVSLLFESPIIRLEKYIRTRFQS